MIDLATASYLILQKGITNLKVAGEAGMDIQLAIGTTTQEPSLNSILQKGLMAISEAEREEINHHWINMAGHSTQTCERIRC